MRTLLLVLAAMTTGLTAGVYALYAHTVMPGLRMVDDRTFVAAFQAIDRAILNPWFMVGGFIGAPVLTAATLARDLAGSQRAVAPYAAMALALDLVVIGLTVRVNVPLNDALKRAGDPDAIDVSLARVAFAERRWVRANLARVVLSLGAFASLAWSLVVQGGPT